MDTYLFTGLACSGKSTLTREIYGVLASRGNEVVRYDGDEFRKKLAEEGIELGFTPEDRRRNLEFLAFHSREENRVGKIVLASFIAPLEEYREMIREMVEPERFKLVYVQCPLEVCEARDVKGMYAKARRGEIPNFTGISAPFEEPKNLPADLVLDTSLLEPEECVNIFLRRFNFPS